MESYSLNDDHLNDVLYNIFEFFTINDLFHVIIVCTKWKHLVFRFFRLHHTDNFFVRSILYEEQIKKLHTCEPKYEIDQYCPSYVQNYIKEQGIKVKYQHHSHDFVICLETINKHKRFLSLTKDGVIFQHINRMRFQSLNPFIMGFDFSSGYTVFFSMSFDEIPQLLISRQWFSPVKSKLKFSFDNGVTTISELEEINSIVVRRNQLRSPKHVLEITSDSLAFCGPFVCIAKTGFFDTRTDVFYRRTQFNFRSGSPNDHLVFLDKSQSVVMISNSDPYYDFIQYFFNFFTRQVTPFWLHSPYCKDNLFNKSKKLNFISIDGETISVYQKGHPIVKINKTF